MNKKTPYILLFLLIAGAGYLLYSRTELFRSEPAPTEPDNEVIVAAKPLLPGLLDVRQIVIQNGSKRITLARQDSAWQLVEPITAPADESRVAATSNAMTSLTYSRKYEQKDKDYPKDELTHLSSPLRVVRLTDGRGVAHTIKVGQKVPLAGQTFVQVDDDPAVYKVEADVPASLTQSPTDYRRRKLLDLRIDQAGAIDIRGDQAYRLVKSGANWMIEQPIPARANADAVNRLLAGLAGLTAEAFVDDQPADLAPFGLDRPRVELVVELAPPAPASTTASAPATTSAPARRVTVAIGTASGGKVFAKLGDSPSVFQVSQSQVEALAPKLADLRDKALLAASETAPNQIELALPSGKILLVRAADGWKMQNPIAGDCDAQSIADLLKTLAELKVAEFIDKPASLEAFGLEQPVGKLRLIGTGQTTELLLGRASESGQMGFVMIPGSKTVAVLPAAEYGQLLRPAAGYWRRTLLELPANARITQVEVFRPDSVAKITQARPGVLEMVEPVKAPVDKVNAAGLLSALRNVRADKVISLGYAVPERFQKLPAVRVRFAYTTAPPEPTFGPTTASAPAAASAPTTAPAVTISVGPLVVVKENDKSYAWLETDAPKPVAAVGELPGAFFDLVNAELHDRTVLRFDPARIVAFKVDIEKVALELTKAGDEWRYETDRMVRIPADKMRQFLADLSSLQATRFIDFSDKPRLERYALQEPAMVFHVTDAAGKSSTLTLSRTGPVGTEGYYAVSSDTPGVFVLTAESSRKMRKTLADIQPKVAPATTNP